MKQKYIAPQIVSYDLSVDSPILNGSSRPGRVVYTEPHKLQKNYNCPYVSSLGCEKYSRYINKFAETVNYMATHKINADFVTMDGCPYKDKCEVYSLYLYKKIHQQNNGK